MDIKPEMRSPNHQKQTSPNTPRYNASTLNHQKRFNEMSKFFPQRNQDGTISPPKKVKYQPSTTTTSIQNNVFTDLSVSGSKPSIHSKEHSANNNNENSTNKLERSESEDQFISTALDGYEETDTEMENVQDAKPLVLEENRLSARSRSHDYNQEAIDDDGVSGDEMVMVNTYNEGESDTEDTPVPSLDYQDAIHAQALEEIKDSEEQEIDNNIDIEQFLINAAPPQAGSSNDQQCTEQDLRAMMNAAERRKPKEHIGNNRWVTVKEQGCETIVGIRQFTRNLQTGNYVSGNPGINLTVEEFRNLVKHADRIEELITTNQIVLDAKYPRSRNKPF